MWGGIRKGWNWEMWYGEPGGSKTKLVKPQAFPLIKTVSGFYWIQHVYGRGSISGVHVWMEPNSWDSHRLVFTFSCKTHMQSWHCPPVDVHEHKFAKSVSSPHSKDFSIPAFLLLVGILKVLSASPFFGTPLRSHSVSNNLVIFHHISSTKLSISDAILIRLQNPMKIVSKKVNVISKA